MEVLLSFGAALLALRLAGALFGRWRARRAPELLAWTCSLLAYAAASGALAWGAAAGWDSRSFRAYYLFGGLLTAPLLGAGSLLLSGRRWAGRVVLVWIGGLKFASYEADGIVPLVANSPFMSFLYPRPAPEYRQHMNREGQLVPANQRWNESNRTYPVSDGLGVVILSIGILIALYPIWPQVSAIGSFLLVLMSLTTLSFLVTTPEAWVPALGDPHHGFPYLSGAGRLIVKDCIMLGAAVLTMSDAANTYLRRRG